jgi:hypothetical protein
MTKHSIRRDVKDLAREELESEESPEESKSEESPEESKSKESPEESKPEESPEEPGDQEEQETSALGSEKSGHRCTQDQLTITIQGIQHTLLVLSQGLKKLVSQKRQAQKAHARRERRRAQWAPGAANQPRFPADCPQTQTIVGDYGNKAEAGTQPPTEDWAPSEEVNQGDTELMNWVIPEGLQEVQVLAARPVQSGQHQVHGNCHVHRVTRRETGNARRRRTLEIRNQERMEKKLISVLRWIQDTETHVG